LTSPWVSMARSVMGVPSFAATAEVTFVSVATAYSD
jgi:hypothetical protein